MYDPFSLTKEERVALWSVADSSKKYMQLLHKYKLHGRGKATAEEALVELGHSLDVLDYFKPKEGYALRLVIVVRYANMMHVERHWPNELLSEYYEVVRPEDDYLPLIAPASWCTSYFLEMGDKLEHVLSPWWAAFQLSKNYPAWLADATVGGVFVELRHEHVQKESP